MDQPQRVTKPIQLLAAWLTGLTVIDGSFLGSAYAMGQNSWERGALIIASILYVPGFLFAIFLLQTKFRPELQEDAFYYKYISRKDNSATNVNRFDIIEQRINELRMDFQSTTGLKQEPDEKTSTGMDWSDWKIGLNDYLPFYEAVKNALKKADIPVSVTFGKSNGSKEIKDYVVSISEELGYEYCLALLKVLVAFPFKEFHFWQPLREVGEDEDVYIGSYGSESNVIPFTKTVREQIQKATTASDLNQIIRRNQN